MPDFLERRLRANVPRGVNADRYVYGAMNNMGAMRGNKETAKGKAMQRKHDKKVKRVHRGVTDLL
jgi:hypothetical protein